MQASPGPAELPQEAAVQASPGPAELPQEAAPRRLRGLLRPAAAVSKVISIFHQSARDAVRTCLDSLLPFMGFAALFIGICRGSGLTEFLASGLQPMGGSLPGLMGLGIICSIPGLSAVLGAGAVAAQMFSTVIGDLIAAGTISPAMALPALFAINTQCACDFIPVGLSMTGGARHRACRHDLGHPVPLCHRLDPHPHRPCLQHRPVPVTRTIRIRSRLAAQSSESDIFPTNGNSPY